MSAFRARPLPSRVVGRRPFDPWREIHDRGDADLALAFGRLFWPVFVERRGCVVIEHRAVDSAIVDALERAGGDVRRVEELLNRVSLRQEMPFEDSEVEDAVFMEVGRIMRRSWMAALAEQFPGRQFFLELLDSEDDWHGPLRSLRPSPRHCDRPVTRPATHQLRNSHQALRQRRPSTSRSG